MDRMVDVLRDRLGEKRLSHTMAVVEESVKLARLYDAPQEKVRLAALLHDFAKGISLEESLKLASEYCLILDDVAITSTELIHGPLGAKLVQDHFDINDMEILDAITYHTTGRENMSTIEKIVFLADFIEPGRNFHGIDTIRETSRKCLDKAVFMALDSTISYLLKKGSMIHVNTVNARNFILREGIGD